MLRPIPMRPFLRKALPLPGGMLILGGLLRLLSDTPEFRAFGTGMAITGLAGCALMALMAAALKWYTRPQL